MPRASQSSGRVRRLAAAFAMAIALAAAPQSQQVAELAIVRRVWTIGVESGPREQEFGKIIDAAWDSAGRVYLLDGGARMVRVFSADGRFLHTVSREGRGPGELTAPSSLRHDGGSTLYVLDGVNGLALFRTGGQATEYLRTIRPATAGAEDFCLLGERLFVYSPTADLKIVHEVAPNGRVIRSFGETFGPRAYPPTTRRVMSLHGKLSCHARHGLVVTVVGDLPEIRAYRAADGSLAWSDSLRAFSPPILEPTPGGGIKRSFSRGPNHHTQVLRPLDDNFVLAQARRVSPNEIIDSWVIDVRTGRHTPSTAQLLRLPQATPTRGLLLQEKPYSTVSLVELRRAAR